MLATQNTIAGVAGSVRGGAIPVAGSVNDYDALLDRIGGARFVLIGEASHGTHEFYYERAVITKRLIREKGFSAVAVEADKKDAYEVNRYVRAASAATDAEEALRGFVRFPSWMWRNTVVVDFVEWLRGHNDSLAPKSAKTGFYGLDLYSLYSSIRAVIEYLEKVDPAAARRARSRYSCFEHFHESTEAYGYNAGFGLTESCEQDVVNQLVELQQRAGDLAQRDGHIPEDEYFFAEQNARLVRTAEQYYRTMFQGRISSWNLRDRHMAETLERLASHLTRKTGRAKIVVWEHNSHLGDARATEMGRSGEFNVGQLVRERYGRESVLVGLTTYSGTVTATSDWDRPAERKRVRPALRESYEAVLHDVGLPQYSLVLAPGEEHTTALSEPRLERAIGVIYRPQTERQSHYF